MKTRITSILLVMVLAFAFTMTACANTGAQVAAFTELESLDQEEASEFLAEMVNASERTDLSVEEMNTIAINLWNFRSVCSKEEFETQAYAAFANIYAQANQRGITLEKLDRWTYLPVPSILCEYFSSSNFYSPEFVECTALEELAEEDATHVVEAYCENSLMETNSSFALLVIQRDFNEEATAMAWEHLYALSNTDNSRMYELDSEAIQRTCENILLAGQCSEDNGRALIANILENPCYSITWKYAYFCNHWYGEPDNELYSDICTMVHSSLFELAQDSNVETTEQLKELAELLRDDTVASKLLSML